VPRPLASTGTVRGRRRARDTNRAPSSGPAVAGRRALDAARSLWAVATACVVAAAVSLALPSAPTYDPWAWIVWGREITQLDLDTHDGPSWKPLPVVFTTLFAPFGDAAPELWLVVARAGALFALVMAYRLASRLAGAGLAGAFAGAFAVAGLVLTDDFVRNAGLGNSEGLLVALVLLAIERHLDGARTHALAAGFGAALLRPETWPFLGLYALYLWRADARARRVVVALLALIPVLWFLPELWGSGDPLRASERARDPDPNSPAYAARPALEILRLTGGLVFPPVPAGALVGVVLASVAFARARRVGPPLVLAAAALAWVALVALMTEAGFAGNPRYLVLAVALACVLGGFGWTAAVRDGAALVRRASERRRLAAAAAAAVALVVVAGCALSARYAIAELETEYAKLLEEGRLYQELPGAVARAGGPERVLACGRPLTGRFHVPALAWHLGVHAQVVDYEAETPSVVFRARGDPEPVVPVNAVFRPLAATARWSVSAACRP
jgi:hypothetical protein